MEKFVFVERDGVINVQQDAPIQSIDQLVFLPFVYEAMHHFAQNDVKPIVMTMQKAVAEGTIPQDAVDEIHQAIRDTIAENEGQIHDIFMNPLPGMPFDKFAYPSSNLLRLAVAKHKIDPTQTFFITNRIDALQAAWEMGCKTIFVRTGKIFDAKRQLLSMTRQPDYNVKDLMAAAVKVVSFYSQS
ncbi:MAG: HAD hydrolase-like protein [bacterium]|jgi:D-glycero-D-manno-heptose 1,7-bisphosphate phosphatase|nr:HAD hydrolase-like protein [bacterium]